MSRTSIYIPLFPAAGGADSGPAQLLALGFEGGGLRVCCAALGLSGPLGGMLDQTQRLLGSAGCGMGWDRAWLGRRIFPLDPVPTLTDVAGAQLGLALGLTLAPGSGDRRLLAFGRLELGQEGLRVRPVTDLTPLLALLSRLVPQPRPLLCLLPLPVRSEPQVAPWLDLLAGHNLRCCLIGSLDDGARACAEYLTSTPACPRKEPPWNAANSMSRW